MKRYAEPHMCAGFCENGDEPSVSRKGVE